MKRRHKFFYALLQPLVLLFLKIRFGYRYKKIPKLPPNYIVLSNHTTDYDVVLVGAALRRQMYFVSSEHITRWGRLFKILNYVFAPIVRYKGASAGGVVMDVLRKTRKGGNVCIFAEGVRSWDGVSCPILPSTAQLCKAAGCGLVTFHLTGGYFASPMWGGASVRRGRLYGEVVHTFTKEELAAMSEEEIYRVIVEDLHEDAYERQLQDPRKYRSRRRAEHLENLMFRCPVCGAMDCFKSEKDTVRCNACGLEMQYDVYGMLHGGPFGTVKEFSDWQKERVDTDLLEGRAYTAPSGKLVTVVKHEAQFVTSGEVCMTEETFSVGERSFCMEEIGDLAMHGQHAIVFTVGKEYFELVPESSSNALKFYLYYTASKKKEKVKVG